MTEGIFVMENMVLEIAVQETIVTSDVLAGILALVPRRFRWTIAVTCNLLLARSDSPSNKSPPRSFITSFVRLSVLSFLLGIDVVFINHNLAPPLARGPSPGS